MSELITPYEVGSHYEKTVSIVDVNGLWAFDCYKEDVDEILKRINGYEQLQASNQELLDALEYAKKRLEDTRRFADYEMINKAITNAKQVMGDKG